MLDVLVEEEKLFMVNKFIGGSVNGVDVDVLLKMS